jgi:hypothetical protein
MANGLVLIGMLGGLPPRQGCTRRSRRRAALVAITVPLLAVAADAGAQTLGTCAARASRPAVDVGVTGNIANAYIGQTIVEQDLNEEVLVRRGIGLSATGIVPLGSRFGVRVEIGRASLGIDRYIFRDLFHTKLETTTGIGNVALSQLTIGVVRHVLTGDRLCGYTVVSAGLYRFAYGNYRANNGGIAGTLGFAVPTSPAASLMFEVQMHAVDNRSRPPLAVQIVFLLRASAGVRIRF